MTDVPNSAVVAVAKWEAEWLANPNHDPWGDVLSWDAARKVAERLDQERAAMPAAGEAVASEYETLIAAGLDDYAARCALRTEDDGGFCHAYFYSDGQWRFQTGGNDLHGRDGEVVQCVLTKRLYASPAPSDQEKLLAELVKALEPFANCADELDGSQDVPRAPDGEWAKFRLLTDDYRRAREAIARAHNLGAGA